MFLALVNTGISKKMDSDETIRMPPKMENNPSLSYDSINGITQNTNVYTVYDNMMAYPEYLITYTYD